MTVVAGGDSLWGIGFVASIQYRREVRSLGWWSSGFYHLRSVSHHAQSAYGFEFKSSSFCADEVADMRLERIIFHVILNGACISPRCSARCMAGR